MELEKKSDQKSEQHKYVGKYKLKHYFNQKRLIQSKGTNQIKVKILEEMH